MKGEKTKKESATPDFSYKQILAHALAIVIAGGLGISSNERFNDSMDVSKENTQRIERLELVVSKKHTKAFENASEDKTLLKKTWTWLTDFMTFKEFREDD